MKKLFIIVILSKVKDKKYFYVSKKIHLNIKFTKYIFKQFGLKNEKQKTRVNTTNACLVNKTTKFYA